MCLCVDPCEGLCECIFLSSPKAVVSDMCFWSFLPHLWAPMGDPFTPELSLGKRSSMLATVMIFMGQTRLVAIGTLYPYPLWCCFSHVFFFLVIFPPFLHGHGRPHDSTKTFNNKCAVLGSYLNDVHEQKKPRQIHYKSIASGI